MCEVREWYHNQASFIRAILQWGGGSGWVGLKLWTPPPSYNSEGFLGWAPATPSFFGHRSLVWLFAGAPFCCVVVQVAGVQVAIFHMADFGCWVLDGWVQSWVGGSCPKYPPPSYKRSLTTTTKP